MELLLVILIILACFNFILKQSFNKAIVVFISSSLLALFVAFSWKWAILQSKNQISSYLQNSVLMKNIAVLMSIEVFLQLYFCFLAVKIKDNIPLSPKAIKSYKLLRFFPGFLIFPSLFSILTYTIFSFPGHSFALIACMLALVILLLTPTLYFLLKYLIPEKDIRLELLFLLNLVIVLLGMIATVNGATSVKSIDKLDWKAFGAVSLIILFLSLIGLLYHYLLIKRKQRDKNICINPHFGDNA